MRRSAPPPSSLPGRGEKRRFCAERGGDLRVVALPDLEESPTEDPPPLFLVGDEVERLDQRLNRRVASRLEVDAPVVADFADAHELLRGSRLVKNDAVPFRQPPGALFIDVSPNA